MPVTFSLLVKGELAGLPVPRAPEAVRAELAGLARTAGAIQGCAGRWALEVTLNHSPTARRAFRLIKAGFGVRTDIMVKKRRSPRTLTQYVVRVPPLESETVLKGLGFWGDSGLGTGLVSQPGGAKPRRAYLRGAFLGSGSVASPESTHHLEVRFQSEAPALGFCDLLLSEGIKPGVRAKNHGWLVYLKECEEIVKFLTLAGAHGAVLRYQDVRVLRDVRGRVNRVVNCETANVTKIVDAGVRQVEAILLIERTIGLDALSPSLGDLARLRLEHPDLSLKELGELLEPVLGKSGVNHRLRRLSMIAQKLTN
jgi:DNA-binding protein WhiA